MSEIRVRFAPSPTGPLHIGGLRTALFNYLFAKNNDGKFILRIEDTDQNRFIPGAEEYILESLQWCGISPDEGIGADGDFGPYRQSERKDMYRKYALQLIDSGTAYYAFDTPGDLDAKRKEFEANKMTFTYDSSSRMSMRNSLSISAEETNRKLDNGDAYVIRFKFDEDSVLVMEDKIRGEVKVDTSKLDDKILFKSDGMPTYHLANVVDDYLMKISHVIRGEEWLPSMPLHVSLYDALGWQDSMPEFAHLPLILKPDGKGKLSKRDGDRGGFPVFPLEWKDPKNGEVSSGYRESGYFPEACINILAFLGWNPGTEKEIYSLEELVKDFDLSKVGKAGAKFDPDKARWFNHHYMQEKSSKELSGLFWPILAEKEISVSEDKLEVIVDSVKERADFIANLWEQSSFFFEAPSIYDEDVVKKQWKGDTAELMSSMAEYLKTIDPFEESTMEERVKAEIVAKEWGMGKIMAPLRLLLVGESKGPSLFKIMEILGKEEVLKRIKNGLIKLK